MHVCTAIYANSRSELGYASDELKSLKLTLQDMASAEDLSNQLPRCVGPQTEPLLIHTYT